MKKLNKYSSCLTQAGANGIAKAMLYGAGLKEEDMAKPEIGIGSVWFEGNPCNLNLLKLGQEIKKSVQEAGMVGFQFNTIGVSDAISMGTKGMRFSLPSRDLIADSIETISSGQWHDGLVVIPGCDKNMPGVIMALGRLNRPSLMVYGGAIHSGSCRGKKVTLIDVAQSYGQSITGQISEDTRQCIIKGACPGAGSCGGMYTANTMAMAIEALGMALPYSSSNPATSTEKIAECAQVGHAIRKLLEMDLKPRDIMTRGAFENAITMVMALGGSTNSVIHLIAMAKSVGVPLTIDDFHQISERVPYIAALQPNGPYYMEDLHEVGGVPAVMKYLLEAGYLKGDCLTVTGRTMAENLSSLPGLKENQQIVVPINTPIKETGHIRILKGNLAPGGAVAKISGHEGLFFKGPAKVYDGEESALEGLKNNQISKGDVVVVRYVGPKGGPGMPEMLVLTSYLVGAGLSDQVALITDGRFSGASHGFIIGHIVPEAQEGGAIALIENGDLISIDAVKNTIQVDLIEEELQKRLSKWVMPAYKAENGVLLKYIKSVSHASNGCVTDE